MSASLITKSSTTRMTPIFHISLGHAIPCLAPLIGSRKKRREPVSFVTTRSSKRVKSSTTPIESHRCGYLEDAASSSKILLIAEHIID